MTKIAVCFTGFLRTANYTVDSFLRFFGDLYPNVDIFIHTWDKNQNKVLYRASKKVLEIFEKHNINSDDYRQHKYLLAPKVASDTLEVLNDLYKKYNKNKIVFVGIEKFDNLSIPPYYRTQEYLWYNIIEKVIAHEKLFNFKYDVVVKTRADIVIPKYYSLKDELDNFLLDPNGFYSQRYNAVNSVSDVFHMARSEIMKIAYDFGLADAPQLARPNSKNMGTHLTNYGIKVYGTKLHDFAVYRPETIPTSSLNYEKCYNIDQDWYWSANNNFRYPEENI